ncbi:MAG: hypothetical protein NC332_02140, partial [Firmicutes bacterium]|nr:hypothetical protein [Bacillota bacterium]
GSSIPNVSVIDELGDIIALITETFGIELPEADVDLSGLNIEKILSCITVDLNGNSPRIYAEFDGNILSVNLAQSDFGFVSVTGVVFGRELEIRQSNDTVKLDVGDGSGFIPVSLLTGYVADAYKSFVDLMNNGARITLAAEIEIKDSVYFVESNIAYNKGIRADIKVREGKNYIIDGEVYYVNGVVYASVNGIKIASETSVSDNGSIDAASVLKSLYGYSDVLDGILNGIEEISGKLADVEIGKVIKEFEYNGSELALTFNGEQFGIDDVEVTLSGTDELTLSVKGLSIGEVALSELSVSVVGRDEAVEAPSAELYVTDVTAEIFGYEIVARIDVYNKKITAYTEMYGETIALLYDNGVVYVNYGAVKVKLAVNEIERLLEVINKFTEISLPEIDSEIPIPEIIKGIAVEFGENGTTIKASYNGIALEIAIGSDGKIGGIEVDAEGMKIVCGLTNSYVEPSIDRGCADVIEIAERYCDAIAELLTAEGYGIKIEGSVVVSGKEYFVESNIAYNKGIRITAKLFYDNINAINAQVWFVDNYLYMSVDDFKLAVRIDGGASGASSIEETLDACMGYNAHVDALLALVKNVIAKFNAQSILYGKLINAFSFDGKTLTLSVDGGQFGTSSPFTVALTNNNGLCVSFTDFEHAGAALSLQATVSPADAVVTAPDGDFTTNLAIKVDEQNTVYANLDLINGVYKLRVDNLNVWYSNGVVKIAAGDKIFATGDISKIIEICQRIDALVNEFSGREESMFGDLDMNAFTDIDVPSIISSLSISSDNGFVRMGLSFAGINMTASFANGTLIKVVAPVMSKTLEIYPAKKTEYREFTDDVAYVAIDEVLEEFLPSIEALVHTNSWKFDFAADSEMTISGQTYRIAKGSYFEFYYSNALSEGMNTFKLRAVLNVLKQRSANEWQDFMSLDIVYKDGSVYVTDTGRQIKSDQARNTLRLTIDVATIEKCASLYGPLVAVIPQIQQIVDQVFAAMAEAEGNAALVDYSTLLRKLSYENGIFNLIINGQVFLSKLGDVVVSASQTESRNGLVLNCLQLAYDNMSLNLENIVVTASDLVKEYADSKNDGTFDESKWISGLQYTAVQDILAYNYSEYHIDFNSMYELLSAFIKTATPKEGENTRAFYISGEIPVNILTRDITLEVELFVDIDENNKVQIAVRLSRPIASKLQIENLVFNDYGGDGYIFYNGVTDKFDIVRNSYVNTKVNKGDYIVSKYCAKCGKEIGLFGDCNTVANWERHGSKYLAVGYHKAASSGNTVHLENENYIESGIDSATFSANAIDYILQLVNFGSAIEDEIKKAITKENTNDYGIEDVLKDYKYTTGDFNISADLSPIDSSLGTLNIDVLYNENDFTLTNLNGSINLISICTAQLNLELNAPVYGVATQYVANRDYWRAY